MKRFFSRIGRFFWSWGFLKFVLWAATIIVFLYVEEDWRGARMWAQTKAKWEAKGETFDFSRFIPPPIPDSENLAAIPLFKLEPEPESGGQPGPRALRKALHQDAYGFSNISMRVGMQKLPDFEKLKQDIAADYEALFHTTPTNDPLAQFDAIYPFIADLNAASSKRPYCRFALDYTSQPPYARPFSPITLQLSVAKILSIHADLALAAHRPDLALPDLETAMKLNSGVEQEPILVSGLVAIADTAIVEGGLNTGLALHAWSDAQLSQIEFDLNQSDFLTEYRLSLCGERTGFSLPTLDWLKTQRTSFGNLFGTEDNPAPAYARNWIPVYWPGGWLDANKGESTNILMESLALADPSTHRVFPERGDELMKEIRGSAQRWDGFAPWKIYASISLGPMLNAAVKFARGQAQLDEARIACALERYRLAHGAYPATLEELAPAYIAEIPHDVINGEPYRYRLRSDGTFLLYSVGWNEKDEGGLIITDFHSDDPDDSKDKHGDWVWPTLK